MVEKEKVDDPNDGLGPHKQPVHEPQLQAKAAAQPGKPEGDTRQKAPSPSEGKIASPPEEKERDESPAGAWVVAAGKIFERVALYIVVAGLMGWFAWSSWNASQPDYTSLIGGLREADGLTDGCRYHFLANLHVLHTGFSIRFFGAAAGALISLLGAMFVLHRAVAAFELSVAKGDIQSLLKTASPGLVMITLGSAVLISSVLRTQTFELDSSGCLQQLAPPTQQVNPFSIVPGASGFGTAYSEPADAGPEG